MLKGKQVSNRDGWVHSVENITGILINMFKQIKSIPDITGSRTAFSKWFCVITKNYKAIFVFTNCISHYLLHV